jgi:WD40 repeat protein
MKRILPMLIFSFVLVSLSPVLGQRQIEILQLEQVMTLKNDSTENNKVYEEFLLSADERVCDNQFNRLFSFEGYTTVEWSPDSNEVASVGIFNTLRVWSVTSGEVLTTSNGGENNILNISWHSDAIRIVTGHLNGEIRIWERLTPDAFWLIGNAYIPELNDVEWIGNQLITTSMEGIQVWNVN